MKDKHTMIIIFVGGILVIGFVFSTMISDVGINRVLPFLLGMPVFIIAILFAVFGKDLFKKSTKQQKNGDVKHE